MAVLPVHVTDSYLPATVSVGSIEKYISVLEEASMTNLLKSVYARIHDRHEDDLDLQDFFRFKCWI